MSVTRLKDSSLFKQTDDVANFGDKHYARVRDYIDNIVGKDGKEELIEAIEKVWDIYMNKKTTLIHADLVKHHFSKLLQIMRDHPKKNLYCSLYLTKNNISLLYFIDSIVII